MILLSYFLMLDNLNSFPLKIIVTVCHAPGIALGLEDVRTRTDVKLSLVGKTDKQIIQFDKSYSC